jgi:uncharacterized protein YecE (DUF72 family)
MPPTRQFLQTQLQTLAQQGVYLGTSSWKYEGWLDQIYTRDRYVYRGQWSKTRFEKNCLSEYAETFPTVCIDAAYYDFPRPQYLLNLAEQVPAYFQFGLKVTDAITIRKFPNLDRFGPRAGQPNADFLNADLFATRFLEPCSQIRPNIGIILFEFSRFWPTDYSQGRDFLTDLDAFLSKLPTDWPYGIEIRNRHWLVPDYFACLQKHRITHVFNAWDAMPPVHQQIQLPNAFTHPHLVAARFLLKSGRKYAQAVQAFQPYNQTREPLPEARQAGAQLIQQGQTTPNRKTFVFINNRLEGNSPNTIAAMIQEAAHPQP